MLNVQSKNSNINIFYAPHLLDLHMNLNDPELDCYLVPEYHLDLTSDIDHLLNSSVSVAEVTKSYIDSTSLTVGDKLILQNAYFNEISTLGRAAKTIYSD
jgi:uncharacterized protein (DUF1919 family)